jgi:hypothetical protein
MGRLTSLGCAALILLGSGVVSAQDRRLERIEANIADVCDARMRCITIVSDELKRRCGRDLACVKEKLDDLRARGQADEVSIADLSRHIVELEALLNAALAAQSSAVPEDDGTPNDVAGGAADDDEGAESDPDTDAGGGSDADRTGSAGSGAIRRGSVGEIAERRGPGAGVYQQRERDLRGGDTASGEAPQDDRAGDDGAQGKDARFLDHANETTRPWSGVKASRVASLNAVRNGWLVGIAMAEESDDPCLITIFSANRQFVEGPNGFRQVDGDGSSRGQSDTLDLCTDGAGSFYSRRILAFRKTNYDVTPDYPYAHLSSELESPYALNSLQVCQRSRNDLVKGLRVKGVHLDLESLPVATEQITKKVTYIPSNEEIVKGELPRLVDVEDSREFERPNCNRWAAESRCPADFVGIGVDVHYDMNNRGRALIKGLSLRCAQLVKAD